MVEKIKKGLANHCVTALLLFLLHGTTLTQAAVENSIEHHEQEEIQ